MRDGCLRHGGACLVPSGIIISTRSSIRLRPMAAGLANLKPTSLIDAKSIGYAAMTRTSTQRTRSLPIAPGIPRPGSWDFPFCVGRSGPQLLGLDIGPRPGPITGRAPFP